MPDATPSSSPRRDPAPGGAPWGVWLIGARGSVATTAMVGTFAVSGARATPVGLATMTPAFDDVPLPALDDVVFGGCDLGGTSLPKRAEELAAGGVFPHALAVAAADDLQEVEARVSSGISAAEASSDPAGCVTRIRADLESFAADHDLAGVVVVNVSSTEAPIPRLPAHDDGDALLSAVADGEPVLAPSGLYALAAIEAGFGFVDFTPSSALAVPAVLELAEGRVPVAGRDGKTGETLLKTALAPMFADRSLHVHSWSGMNLLGGGDGETLADPVTAASKVESKGDVLRDILGHQPQGPVRIDHVADLGDWKTAWDLVTFEGFLGTRMQMQFTWQGCDSALASPLVLDLARLVRAASAAGRSGPQAELGWFFKAPVGQGPRRLAAQYDELLAWAHGLDDATTSS